MKDTGPGASDNPIVREQDDAIGRAPMAKSFAHQVLSLDASDGTVVGVLGPWGSGKTSFINLARPVWERAGIQVINFNPWMFSGADQLVQSFFVELSAELKIHPELAEVGKDLEEYGEAFSGWGWLPVVGPWIERGRAVSKLAAKFMQHRKEGTAERRKKLASRLSALKHPLIIVIDDVDRLSTSEIRDIFKLIRVTVSFPNLIYVVAFDRARVETALGEQNLPGRDYLEKILQVAFDLPAVPTDVLNSQISAAINRALDGIANPGPFEEGVWADVFMGIVRPLIRHMRDVRRYGMAIRGTVIALEGQIAVADVLGLEAVRVFLPDVFAKLHESTNALTKTSNHDSRHDSPTLKATIEALVEAGNPQQNVVRKLIDTLFPAAERHIGKSHYGHEWKNTWQKDRRIAHEDYLRLYLEGVAGDGVKAFNDAEKAWPYMSDQTAFDKYLRSLDPVRLVSTINALEAYEGKFGSEHAVPASVVLLNLMPVVAKKPQTGAFDLGGETIVSRVVFRLLRALKDPTHIEAAVRAILPSVTNLSAKFDVIGIVGHIDGLGHQLVPEEAAKSLEAEWRSDVRNATAESLASETNLLQMLRIMKQAEAAGEPIFDVPNDPQVTLALLRGAKGQVTSQSLGSYAVRRSPRLAWDVLTQLYGSEEVLNKRVAELQATNPADAAELLALADRYVRGWRPKAFED